MMNKKAAISKELNAKQVKILEGLLKLPENRECADCKNKAPRWASINLGVFICLQCSGIHRSLGVHISKVRSATLDTWLPDQVAFMQEMGNEKSNAYWEAELPVNYNRSRFEIFIPAKYVEKRWVRKDKKVESPPRSEERLASPSLTRSGSSATDTSSVQYSETKEVASSTQSFDQKSITNADDNQLTEVKKDCSIVEKRDEDVGNSHVRKDTAEDQTTEVAPDPNDTPKKDVQQPKPALPKDESRKVDYATELYRMLCLDDSTESDSSPSSAMSSWVDFDSDEEGAIQGNDVRKSSAEKVHPDNGIKFVPASVVPPETKEFPQEPQKDAIHDNHGSQAPSPNMRKSNNHLLGTQLPMLSIPPVKFVTNTAPHTTSSLYRPAVPINGTSTTRVKKPQAALPVSGYDYDFSFLTQGMFTKQ